MPHAARDVMKLQLVATCLFGLEHLLGEEIDALGYERLHTMDGRVSFAADGEGVALANVFLRYAERVYIRVGAFPAHTFDELFEGVRALPWTDYIGREDAFPVKGHSIRSALSSVPDCQSIIKKAIVTKMQERYPLARFPETGVKYQIEFFLFNDEATLMIDTSGEPLHKRGYRRESNVAPLRETLAGALAALARPREEVLFWDPMCGSGTIAIEAAMKMNRIAPGKKRAFAGEAFPFLPSRLWRAAREEAADGEIRSPFADHPKRQGGRRQLCPAGVPSGLPHHQRAGAARHHRHQSPLRRASRYKRRGAGAVPGNGCSLSLACPVAGLHPHLAHGI